MILEAKRAYFRNCVEKVSDNPKTLWNLLNRSLGRTVNSQLPEHNDSVKLANEFNSFFLSKPLALQSEIMSSPSASASVLGNRTPQLSHGARIISEFRHLSQYEISRILSRSPHKSSSIDPAPTWFLFRFAKVLLPAISKIVNLAITEGMPSIYKKSYVLPLLKKSNLDCNVLGNYRPVSNTPFLAKVIERSIAGQLSEHLEKNNYFDPRQFAYRTHHSCEGALLTVLDTAFTAMDEKKITLVVLLDLSAAFDSVDHSILSNRLKSCGVVDAAHHWIMDYISDRSQVVSINNKLSSSLSITCGVPQGTVLGPILFIVYLVGIHEAIAPFDIQYVLYADDLQLFVTCTVTGFSQTVSRLQECINSVIRWLRASLLTANPSKSEFIILGSKVLLNKLSVSNLLAGSEEIPVRKVVRDLGFEIDSTLAFTKQVSKLRSRSFMALRLVNRIKNCLLPSHYSMLTNSLVLSNLDYCSSLYYGVNKSVLRRLQGVINAVFRCIYKLDKFTNVSHLQSHYHWLNIEQRIQLRLAILMYKVMKFSKPVPLKSLLEDRPLDRVRQLRSSSQCLLEIHRVSNDIGSRAFRVCGPRIWNSLPLEIRTKKTLTSFKLAVTQFLLSGDTN